MLRNLVFGTCLSFIATASLAQGDFVIGLSNSFFGNTQRHKIVDSYIQAAEEAKAQGRIAEYYTLNGDGTVNTQVAHINELILKGVDAILVIAASEAALNGAIQRACAAGIKVIAFDALPTAPCAYKLRVDFAEYGATGAKGIVDVLEGRGNVLLVRGVKGSGNDKDTYDGQISVLRDRPEINIVGEVNGNWSGPVAQSAVAGILPSLPHVDGVISQGGGDGYGILQAFLQSPEYKDDMPAITGGNDTDFVLWWQQEKARSGYATVSVGIDPSSGGAAFWYALNILEGAEPPQEQTYPLTVLTQDNVDDFTGLEPNSIVSAPQDEAWVKEHFLK
ncbi:ABC transporter substrate-binding protein [Paracoccus thiocyanatus]|uniref:Sugar ABC transporter substrate-binding protein n=1 Tax=Paracoccus thiocyanatus TaxID=34006 RepID=A0A3D8PFB2_9RHOB|nr:ABC transporter substrate-binding protein [Paracoccus thiocyanatus]RDW14776.1 sugar ABC transporter substrate-binding protein [Paracoccus thiocyanatus]